MEAVSVEGLSKRYGGRLALDGVSLEVGEGEAVCVAGPNGAGKTTLLEALAGLVSPSAGRALVLGRPVRRGDRALAGLVGYMPQSPSLHPALTAEENLDLFARMHGRHGAVGPTLERLGLAGVRAQRAGTLSYGYRQLLSLAVALVHGPRVLLLDEPTSNLYPSVRKRAWDALRQEREGGAALIYATQTPDEGIADRGVVLEGGRVAFRGSMRDVRSRVLGREV